MRISRFGKLDLSSSGIRIWPSPPRSGVGAALACGVQSRISRDRHFARADTIGGVALPSRGMRVCTSRAIHLRSLSGELYRFGLGARTNVKNLGHRCQSFSHCLDRLLTAPQIRRKEKGYPRLSHSSWTLQISLAYSAIVRSLEKFPTRATLRIDIRIQR